MVGNGYYKQDSSGVVPYTHLRTREIRGKYIFISKIRPTTRADISTDVSAIRFSVKL